MDRVQSWIQVATMLTVVVGIFLVVFELRQSKQLATAGLVSQGWQIAIEDNRTFLGENAASVWSKACLKPSELSDAEAVVLDRILLNLYSRSARVKSIGQFGNIETIWRDVAREAFSWTLSLDAGRWHLENSLADFDQETAAIAREVLDQPPPPACGEHLSEFISELRKQKP